MAHARWLIFKGLRDALGAIPALGGRVYEEATQPREEPLPLLEVVLGGESCEYDSLELKLRRTFSVRILAAALSREEADDAAALVEAAVAAWAASPGVTLFDLHLIATTLEAGGKAGAGQVPVYSASLEYQITYRTTTADPTTAV